MEKFKHTPGPWFSTEVMQHVTGFIISSKESESICRIAKHDGKSKLPSRENARLIAAAPELLEALQDYVDFRSNVKDVPGSILEKARAAIAKAIGVK